MPPTLPTPLTAFFHALLLHLLLFLFLLPVVFLLQASCAGCGFDFKVEGFVSLPASEDFKV